MNTDTFIIKITFYKLLPVSFKILVVAASKSLQDVKSYPDKSLWLKGKVSKLVQAVGADIFIWLECLEFLYKRVRWLPLQSILNISPGMGNVYIDEPHSPQHL